MRLTHWKRWWKAVCQGMYSVSVTRYRLSSMATEALMVPALEVPAKRLVYMQITEHQHVICRFYCSVEHSLINIVQSTRDGQILLSLFLNLSKKRNYIAQLVNLGHPSHFCPGSSSNTIALLTVLISIVECTAKLSLLHCLLWLYTTGIDWCTSYNLTDPPFMI